MKVRSTAPQERLQRLWSEIELLRQEIDEAERDLLKVQPAPTIEDAPASRDNIAWLCTTTVTTSDFGAGEAPPLPQALSHQRPRQVKPAGPFWHSGSRELQNAKDEKSSRPKPGNFKAG